MRYKKIILSVASLLVVVLGLRLFGLVTGPRVAKEHSAMFVSFPLGAVGGTAWCSDFQVG